MKQQQHDVNNTRLVLLFKNQLVLIIFNFRFQSWMGGFRGGRGGGFRGGRGDDRRGGFGGGR